MPKYHNITISFKPDSKHVYEFLRKKDNRSAYILHLIEKDMEDQDNASLKQKIKGIIMEVLNGQDITIHESKKNSTENSFTADDINIINEYF